jgi:CxxC-x17-CxxC domain-containing protein
MYSYLIPAQYTIKVVNNLDPGGKTTILLTALDFYSKKCYCICMKDFKKFGDNRGGGRPSFGGKPSFNKFGGDRGDRPAMMHKTTCAECSKTCEVPFRPNGEKPVFCNDCFSSKRGGDSFDRPQKRDFDSRPSGFNKPAPRFEEPRAEQRPDRRIDDLKQQVESLNAKMDSLISMMSAKAPAKVVVSEVPAKAEPMKKAAKPTTAKATPKAVAKAAPKAPAKKVAAKKKK